AILGVDQVTVLLDEPIDTIVLSARFFVGGEGNDQVAVRTVVLLLEADQVGDPDGGHGFVVNGTAPVKVTLALEEFERIDGPVLAARLDDIEMREQQQRPTRPTGAVSSDQIASLRRRAENCNIGSSKASVLQSGGHGLSGAGCVPCRMCGVDLN